jgi:hypothetical protein
MKPVSRDAMVPRAMAAPARPTAPVPASSCGAEVRFTLGQLAELENDLLADLLFGPVAVQV